ncbi:MAG: ribosomal protein S18-alanine N-acetyltransferase [Acidobacteria bacterium]|nr:ribosomal protein S18-alanine N-acetyltransferase [Acidobacteriota bacterium]
MRAAVNKVGRKSVIRRFDARDAGAVGEILAQSPEAAAWTVKSLEQLNKRGELGWVIEDGKKVVGFLVVRAVVAEAEILNLCVRPEKRRAGLAEALLKEAVTELRRTRVDRVFLEVRESNTAAISFYEKHKFSRTGRRPGYYRDPDEAAVLMMKELTG